jgi:toxin ParE1/3/4
MKNYVLILDARAINDIQDAFDYYDSIYGNLSEKFDTALKNTLAKLKQNPFYQIKYEDIRCLKVKRFPYSIHYTVNENFDEIYILSVVHTASGPDKLWMWQEE